MRGVTLLELLIGLGLISSLITMIGVSDLKDLTRTQVRTDREVLIDALLRARSRAMSGKCTGPVCDPSGSAFGVRIDRSAFTLFEGNTFEERVASRDERITRSSTDSMQDSREVVFSRLSGRVQSPTSIAIEGHIVTIHSNGRIHVSQNPL